MAAMNVDRKLVRSKSGLRIVSRDENNRCPFELCEPPWIHDNECFHCMHCHVRFDFLKRRHHCRRCGRIFCSACCEDKLALPRMCFVDPVRQCSFCAEITRKENEFYEKHLKTLINGATFELSASDTSRFNAGNKTYFCKLSQDHRHLLFDSCDSTCSLCDPLRIDSIRNVKLMRPSEDNYHDIIVDIVTENTMTSGLCIQYEGCEAESCDVILTIGSASNKLQSSVWISAMLKAVKLMFEARNPASQ